MEEQREEVEKYFFDTYALYAIATGEKSYETFSKECEVITSLMNLYELYYTLLKDNKEHLGEEFFDKLVGNCVNFDSDIIKKAAKFRREHIKKKLSYLGCLGYIIALENKIKFLTGDEGFRGMKNVEFVK